MVRRLGRVEMDLLRGVRRGVSGEGDRGDLLRDCSWFLRGGGGVKLRGETLGLAPPRLCLFLITGGGVGDRDGDLGGCRMGGRC